MGVRRSSTTASRARPLATPETPLKGVGPAFVAPYSPSWLDRLTQAIDRAPGPAWLAFLALGATGAILQIGVQQLTGDYRLGPFLPLHIWMTGNFAYLLAMIFYLDRSASTAIDAFRPVLQTSPSEGRAGRGGTEYAELRYRLTTLPPRATAWITVVGGFVLAAVPMLLIRNPAGGPYSLARTMAAFGLSAAPVAFVTALTQFVLTQAVAAAVVYHTIHQLRLIHHIYVHHTRLDLYRLQPLYAFSVLAALTAGGFLLYTYAWFATAPALLDQPGSLGLAVFFAGIAVITFAWPLWGIHRRLVQEKRRLLGESSARFEATVAQLHRRVDRQRLTQMDDLNKTLASLEIEQAALRRIPTWPWEPGTLRGVIAALVLPILIWLIQYLLQRLLG